MKKIVLCLILAAIAGCEEYEYTIEMQPGESELKRRLILEGDLPQEEIDAVEKIYEDKGNNIFEASFNGRIPSHTKGSGHYTSLNTKMGRMVIYSERFKGTDDILSEVNEFFADLDKSIDFVKFWFKIELENHPNYHNLEKFFDVDLRKDLKNIVLQLMIDQVRSLNAEELNTESMVRIGHYLLDRGYFGPEYLPLLIGEVELDWEDDGEAEFIGLVRTFIAGKLDCNENDEALAFLRDSGTIEASVMKAVKKMRPDLGEEDLDDALKDILPDFEMLLDIFPDKDKIEATLYSQYEPISTNGEWDEDAKKVIWTVETRRKHALRYPAFFYAILSIPDEEYQEKHFGGIILEDEGLAKYCYWHKYLTKKQMAEWDTFLEEIGPSEDLPAKLSSFKFKGIDEGAPDVLISSLTPSSPQNKRKKPRISRGDSTDSGSEASETEKPLLTWETIEGEKSVRLAVLARNLGATFSMDISSDGKHLIAGSSRGIVKIWNLEDFAEVLSLNKCLRPGVRRVAFSPDGQSFVAVGHNSGRYDQKIILRDTQSGSEKVRLSDSNDYCVAAVFGSAGKHIVGVDTVKGGIIKIWDTTNGRLLTRFRGKGPCALHSVAGSPDGTRFATGNSIRDVATGERIGTLHGEKLVCPWCITFSPDGEQIVTGHHDGMIYIWNSKDGSEIKNFLGHEGRVYCVAFDPSGQKLASAGLDKTVRIWDMAEEEEILTLRGHQDMVFSVAFSIDGKRLFSSSRDGTVRVWEIQPGK